MPDWDLTRPQWGAGPHRAPVIPLPVPRLVLHHTVTPFWTGAAAARNLQRIGRERGFVDISYSALATRADEVIEGRGWGRQGGHTAGHNSSSHALSLVGNLDVDAMPDGMVRAAVRAVRAHRRVGPGRITHGHRDLAPRDRPTACPGRHAVGRIAALNAAAGGTPPPGGTMSEAMVRRVTREVVRAELARQVVAGSNNEWWQQARVQHGTVRHTRSELAELRARKPVTLIAAHDWRGGDPVWLYNGMGKIRLRHQGPYHRWLRSIARAVGEDPDAVRIDREVLDDIPEIETR